LVAVAPAGPAGAAPGGLAAVSPAGLAAAALAGLATVANSSKTLAAADVILLIICPFPRRVLGVAAGIVRFAAPADKDPIASINSRLRLLARILTHTTA
jgi:hypothetical protein